MEGLSFDEQGGDALELSELTAYAKEKYQIQEQHKWPELPGLSVLADPATVLPLAAFPYERTEVGRRCL